MQLCQMSRLHQPMTWQGGTKAIPHNNPMTSDDGSHCFCIIRLCCACETTCSRLTHPCQSSCARCCLSFCSAADNVLCFAGTASPTGMDEAHELSVGNSGLMSSHHASAHAASAPPMLETVRASPISVPSGQSWQPVLTTTFSLLQSWRPAADGSDCTAV